MIEAIAGAAVAGFARAVTGVRGDWRGCTPAPARRIYVANHRSHGDFVLIWTVLPRALRPATRPVAGAEYWRRGALRRFFGERVFGAVLIERDAEARTADPVAQMGEALGQGSSLILFPEGTRNMGDEALLPLKSGVYHLARQHPDAEIVPVWIDNIGRVMPKGEFLPVPMLCTVAFGAPLALEPDEDKAAFLGRLRAAMLALAPARRSVA